MPLKLLTLNIEDCKHLGRVRATIARHSPDVVCLQEVLEIDCPYLAQTGGYSVKYAASAQLEMTGKDGSSCRRTWGVAVLSRVPIHVQVEAYYSNDSIIRVLREPNDPRRVLIMTELEHEGQLYRIATTHFTWSPGGQMNDDQRTDFARLREVLSGYPEYVLCGDFNAPRGREMFTTFMHDLGLVDHLPASVQTTLDAAFHCAGALELVVDTIFSTPQYIVRCVQVLDGISDHKGILGIIERKSDT